jgi:hypothetical protein
VRHGFVMYRHLASGQVGLSIRTFGCRYWGCEGAMHNGWLQKIGRIV